MGELVRSERWRLEAFAKAFTTDYSTALALSVVYTLD